MSFLLMVILGGHFYVLSFAQESPLLVVFRLLFLNRNSCLVIVNAL